jgi:hypothetical protein
MTTRKELVAGLQLRYGSAAFGDRIRILDEFVALTGYHRKHAIRLLREQPGAAKRTRERDRLYDEAVRQALMVLWEAADRVCGKRLKALIPKLIDAMERHGHLDLDPVIKAKLLQISAATIDRMLANARAHRWTAQTAHGGGFGHPAKHSGAYLRRLARSTPGLLRDRHGRTLRWLEDRRRVRAHPHAD